MLLFSDYRPVCPIVFPTYMGVQRYMHSFDASHQDLHLVGLGAFSTMVSRLLGYAGVCKGAVHMTVDEKIVQPGMSQRRPRPHVDGCFVPARNKWGGGGGWLHTCNDLGLGYPLKRMEIIVASSVPGCRVWKGLFQGAPTADGDLCHIQKQLNHAHWEVLPANVGYLLSPDCVHESLVYKQPTQRQFLRLAFSR